MAPAAALRRRDSGMRKQALQMGMEKLGPCGSPGVKHFAGPSLAGSPAVVRELESDYAPFEDALVFAPRLRTPASPSSFSMARADFGGSSMNSTPTPTPGMQ